MPKFTTAERLKQIMTERNLKQIDIINLAKPYCDLLKVKLGRNDLSQYISGKIKPGQSKLYVLGCALNVSEAWLMGFDVPMEKPKKEKVVFSTKKILEALETCMDLGDDDYLTKDENKLIDDYRALNDTGKKKIREYISDLKSAEKYTRKYLISNNAVRE